MVAVSLEANLYFVARVVVLSKVLGVRALCVVDM